MFSLLKGSFPQLRQNLCDFVVMRNLLNVNLNSVQIKQMYRLANVSVFSENIQIVLCMNDHSFSNHSSFTIALNERLLCPILKVKAVASAPWPHNQHSRTLYVLQLYPSHLPLISALCIPPPALPPCLWHCPVMCHLATLPSATPAAPSRPSPSSSFY